MTTRKQRMLNAYKGIYSDHTPVAPEFWFYYPAKVLGISVAEFQHEIPHWYGMQQTFNKFDADGWGIAGADLIYPDVSISTDFKNHKIGEYRETVKIASKKKEFVRTNIYHDKQPFWIESHPIKSEDEIDSYLELMLNEDIDFDFQKANEAHKKVGNDFLLEFDLGLSFFDFFEDALGFEQAIFYFMSEEESILKKYADRYLAHKTKLLRQAVKNTNYESFFIGCSSSCVALLGANLWRKWDKPYEKAMTDEAHKLGKLVHTHNHGKCMEIVPDFVEIGFDCVCPFERDPGDVNGLAGLLKVREVLDNKVTFNGNIHTVQALINGSPDLVREQVREIREAFKGTPRVIIGTGDQVGGETPEENIYAMIDEARK